MSLTCVYECVSHFPLPSFCRPERGGAGSQHSPTASPPIWTNCSHVHPPAGMHLVCHSMPQSEQRTTDVVHPRNMGQLPPVQSRYTALTFTWSFSYTILYDHNFTHTHAYRSECFSSSRAVGQVHTVPLLEHCNSDSNRVSVYLRRYLPYTY